MAFLAVDLPCASGQGQNGVPVISALGRLRPEDNKFQASLDYSKFKVTLAQKTHREIATERERQRQRRRRQRWERQRWERHRQRWERETEIE